MRQARRYEEAAASYKRAIDILEQLVKKHPRSLAHRAKLGLCYHGLADVYRRAGQPVEALASSQRAVETHEELAAENPVVTGYRSKLAAYRDDLAKTQADVGQHNEALALYREDRETWEALVAEHPTRVAYVQRLRTNYIRLINLYSNLKQYGSAQAACGRGMEFISKLTGEQPANVGLRGVQASLYSELGEVQVCFDVTREGFPRRIAVRRSSHRYFEKAARKAVRRSTWQAVPKGEDLPAIKACRTFRFSLVPVPPSEREPASSEPRPR